MFDRPQSGERTILAQIGLAFPLSDAELTEFQSLAVSAGAEILDNIVINRREAEPKFFIGQGKAEEIAAQVTTLSADLVMFNATLSPTQERNLEKRFKCRVLDRTGLILDIFAQRARSHEGKLQVELAQLKHLSTRLIRGWTHLERQKGGIGLRGPGETQLETDRRLLQNRINQINRRLAKVEAQRDLVRRGRKRRNQPTVAVVGYTNAGKSTLFNRLTGAEVYAKDRLFATLDTTLRKLEHNGSEAVMLTDTVGFVSNLPHELVAAFKSTLQETVEADCLLHVIDCADPEHVERERHVLDILKDIGADKIPVIRVYNKIDLTGQRAAVIKTEDDQAIFVSANTGEGLDLLKDALLAHFYGKTITTTLTLNPTEAKLRAHLYDAGVVMDEDVDEQGYLHLNLRLSQTLSDKFAQQYPDIWQV